MSATRFNENGSSVCASGSCAAANNLSTSMNVGLPRRRRGAMGIPRKASAWTATHLVDCGAHGWATRRTVPVRWDLRYGGLQCLAQDEVVPASECPAPRDHGQRRVSCLARNGTAHRANRRNPAVPRAVFSRPEPYSNRISPPSRSAGSVRSRPPSTTL